MKSSRVAVFSIAALALWLRVRNAWTVLETLSRTTLPDDAFYDFAIAKNLAMGRAPSIDGIHATNGYHPLWVAILTVIYRLLPPTDLRTPVYVALTVGALFDVGALLLLVRIARRLSLGTGALLASFVFALSTGAIVNATCGLETPLALLLLLAVAERQLAGPRTVRDFAILGVLSGLAVLARTDAVIPCAVMILASTRLRVRPLVIAVGTAVSCVTPWLVYSYRTTGTLVQSSAIALSIVIDRMPTIWGYEHLPFSLRIERLAAAGAETWYDLASFSGLGIYGLGFVVALAVAAIAIARGPRRLLARKQLARIAPLVGGMLVLLVLHALVRRVFRPWYTAPYIALVALGVGFGVEHLARAARARTLVVLAAIALTITFAIEGRTWQRDGIYPGGAYRDIRPSPGMYQGHTDCGAVAYFSGFGIVNLDGVVNSSAVAALREGKLLRYLEREKFDRIYATDHYHDAVYFGPHYRDSLRTAPTDPRAVRLATVAEKDALVTLGHESISLGGLRGRDLLDDGWIWSNDPPPEGWASSLGKTSRILVFVPTPLPPGSRIEVMLHAAVGPQQVEARLDSGEADGPPTTWSVGTRATWFAVPVSTPGRHHLTMVFSNPTPVRLVGNDGWWAWWRSLRGNALRAIEANGIRLVRASDVRLPPEGPRLEAPAADAALVSGFLGVERDATPAAVWAVTKRSELSFWSDRSDDRTLSFDVGPPPDGMGQSMTVQLNGVDLGTIVLGRSIEHRTLRTQTALVVGENHLVLTFARTSGDLSRAAYFRGIQLE